MTIEGTPTEDTQPSTTPEPVVTTSGDQPAPEETLTPTASPSGIPAQEQMSHTGGM
ncbi:hypothetical protein GCM10023194_80890 [Planotetraspora phitsanulokensis]